MRFSQRSWLDTCARLPGSVSRFASSWETMLRAYVSLDKSAKFAADSDSDFAVATIASDEALVADNGENHAKNSSEVMRTHPGRSTGSAPISYPWIRQIVPSPGD